MEFLKHIFVIGSSLILVTGNSKSKVIGSVSEISQQPRKPSEASQSPRSQVTDQDPIFGDQRLGN